MSLEKPEEHRHPRAFLSHSSLDNARFASQFATDLRERGIDVWYDEWELNPGDSIVDKIFEEGLSQAEVFIVILSEHSVESRWVREEVNAALVNRIERYCKLIPIVLDGVAVPESLRSTKYQAIKNLNNYSEEFEIVVRTIYGITDKPALGNPPSYVSVIPLPGLQAIDTRVLQVALQQTIDRDMELIDSRSLLDALSDSEVSESALLESLEILESKHFLKIVRTMARGIDGMSAFVWTTVGLSRAASELIPDYAKLPAEIAAALVNEGTGSDVALAASLDQPRVLVSNIIDMLVARGMVRAIKTSGPTTSVYSVSPALRRSIQEL